MWEHLFRDILVGVTTTLNDYNDLKNEAIKYNIDEWVNNFLLKGGPLGAYSSFFGPLGEIVDAAALISMIGKMCFGIGHIKGKKVSYEKDMEGILAIWSGAAKGVSKEYLKNNFKRNHYQYLMDKLYNNYVEEIINNRTFLEKLLDLLFKREVEIMSKESFENRFFDEYITLLNIKDKFLIRDNSIKEEVKKILFNKETIIGFDLVKDSKYQTMKKDVNKKISKKIKTKIKTKSFYKKLSSKVLTKTTTKLSTKSGIKLASKFFWIVGAPISAYINIWILDGLAQAAKEYYDSDYLLLEDEISKDLFLDLFSMSLTQLDYLLLNKD